MNEAELVKYYLLTFGKSVEVVDNEEGRYAIVTNVAPIIICEKDLDNWEGTKKGVISNVGNLVGDALECAKIRLEWK